MNEFVREQIQICKDLGCGLRKDSANEPYLYNRDNGVKVYIKDAIKAYEKYGEGGLEKALHRVKAAPDFSIFETARPLNTKAIHDAIGIAETYADKENESEEES